MVVLEYATETLIAFDLSSNSTDRIPGLDQLIAQPLMVPLRVVVLHVFPVPTGEIKGRKRGNTAYLEVL